MSAKSTRNTFRWIHLGASAFLGAYVYSPLAEEPWFRLVVQAGVLPLVTLTGLWLWKGRHLLAWLHARRQRPNQAAAQ